MEKLRLCAPCHFGLESVVNFEAKRIGGENITVTDGKVSFDGDLSVLVKANLTMSAAERILIELASFKAETFEDLFQGVKAIEWESFVGKTDAFPVKTGYSLHSKLTSIPDCQSIIKKAAVERLKSKYGISWFDETGATVPIQFSIFKDTATIYIDTSGEGLHKRGYRRKSNDAPIKETLAAGIIDLARVRSDSIVQDPMCGSGTFLIESAYKALSIAPGIRRSFISEGWGGIPKDIWSSCRDEALSNINKQGKFHAYGSDIDVKCADLSLMNAKKAGVGSKVSVDHLDVKNFKPRNGAITICNPPYGERLLEIKQAEELYKVLGQKLCPSKENPCYIISPHEDFEKFFGKKADKRRKLYNGMIKCQLFMYYL